MLTLAVSGLFLVLAEKWRTVTHGNDGFTFKAPEFFKDRMMFYFVVLLFLVLVYIFLRRFVNSPLGRVLVAVRENEQRTKSLGFNTLHYKVIASVVAGVVASLAGSFYAVSLRFVNTSVLTMDITLDALLMTIIGGVGTLIGPILGAGIIELTQHYLSGLAKDYPIFERWIIFFGIIYILAVIFFPRGVVGTLREKLWKRNTRNHNYNKSSEKGGLVMGVGIVSTGVYIPETKMTAEEIADQSGLPVDVVKTKMGITQKPIPGADDHTVAMGFGLPKQH